MRTAVAPQRVIANAEYPYQAQAARARAALERAGLATVPSVPLDPSAASRGSHEEKSMSPTAVPKPTVSLAAAPAAPAQAARPNRHSAITRNLATLTSYMRWADAHRDGWTTPDAAPKAAK